ncbi:MAG: DUF1036 domain-containing protein [Desulfobacteraceae bacterium]|nr:DUF1036 domain-containing protein [Desulfobacteraceae bacterium]
MKRLIILVSTVFFILCSSVVFAATHRVYVRNACAQYSADYIPIYTWTWNETNDWERWLTQAYGSPGAPVFVGETDDAENIHIFAKNGVLKWEGTSDDFCQDIVMNSRVINACYRPVDLSGYQYEVVLDFECNGVINVKNKTTAVILENKTCCDTQIVDYAIGFQKNGQWVSMGWIPVKSGIPAYLTMSDDEAGKVYCFTKIGTTYWIGNDKDFCIHESQSFVYLPNEYCESPYYRETNFREATYNSDGDYWHCSVY